MALANWTEINNWLDNDVLELDMKIRRTSEPDLMKDENNWEIQFRWYAPNGERKEHISNGSSLQEILSNAKSELGV